MFIWDYDISNKGSSWNYESIKLHGGVGDCSAGHTDENAKQNASFKGNRHCLCVFTYSIAKRKQCNCTAGQSGMSVSPETIYTEGLLSLTFWTFRRCLPYLKFLWISYCKLIIAHILTKWWYQKFGRCLGKDVLQFVEFCSYLNPFLSSVAWCSWKTPVEVDEFCRSGSVIWQLSSIHARKSGKC